MHKHARKWLILPQILVDSVVMAVRFCYIMWEKSYNIGTVYRVLRFFEQFTIGPIINFIAKFAIVLHGLLPSFQGGWSLIF